MVKIVESQGACGAPRRWFTEVEAAERLNMSQKWMQTQRLKGLPPRYAKFGSAVRYAADDLEAFERDSMRSSTSEAPRCPNAHGERS